MLPFRPLWLPSPSRPHDVYGHFSGTFAVAGRTTLSLRAFGAHWFQVRLDGAYLLEGPPRFPAQRPEYDAVEVTVEAGTHRIDALVHNQGVSTRILRADEIPPFFWCDLHRGDEPVAITWKCREAVEYTHCTKRVNPQLAWPEWVDTRLVAADWHALDPAGEGWTEPVTRYVPIGDPKPVDLALVGQYPLDLAAHRVGEGALDMLGISPVFEEPDWMFYRRDMDPPSNRRSGTWRRYDLGRPHLLRPRFTLDVPAGTIVEIAGAEFLVHGRVAPTIALSTGVSMNLHHYVARGGVQTFEPVTPMGARFIEVHVSAPPEEARFVEESGTERCYFPKDAPGALETGDDLLDRIWLTSKETIRGCAEDALTDCPTRERGQWTGDVMLIAMEIASAAYGDLRIIRRGLEHSALCARADGLIAGLCPGGCGYLLTYSLMWVDACVRYHELTGDRTLLEEFLPQAVRCVDALNRARDNDGFIDGGPMESWVFIDWGYFQEPGEINSALNLHYVSCLRSLAQWREIAGQPEPEVERTRREASEAAMTRWLARKSGDGANWKAVDWRTATLALRLGFVADGDAPDVLASIKDHLLACFPNDPGAPRLTDPSMANPQLITPYFMHYTLPEFIKRGEMDFVVEQFESCWGWMLEQCPGSWIEVFDPNWSHCHQWAGSPSWMMSRNFLGLWPRQDDGPGHFETRVAWPAALDRVSGRVPIPGTGDVVTVHGHREDTEIVLHLETPVPITLLPHGAGGTPTAVERESTLRFPAREAGAGIQGDHPRP